jgi:BirA family biotin operon repressor/biotin-[acetyl-CoA-carboxylase] ligase
MDTFQNAPHFHLHEVDSTNNYASKLLKLPNSRNKTAITADSQLFGKGQRGKSWISDPGKNFQGTFIIQTELDSQLIFMLSKWVAWNVIQVLKQYEIAECQIKWPNDIYIGEAKVGGILIENQWQGNNLMASLVGLGVNIASAPLVYNQLVTYLNMHSQMSLTPTIFFEDLKKSFDKTWHLLTPNYHEQLKMLYHAELWGKNGKQLTWILPNSTQSFQGTIYQVHSDGAIEIEFENKERKKYYHGEIFKK